ncbi:MAG: 50S ribosomal protein L21 [Deltaproteobacteria bacterium]|nr:50S ribosomal protein L21 [Deltaproteobacteria bacterium]
MYAVIETGGKQYKVQPGDFIQVEKLVADKGSALSFDKVLLIGKSSEPNTQVWVGKPYLQGALVTGEVVGQGRGKKILIIKYKKRKQYRRTKGHRQDHTQLLITGLDNGSGERLELSEHDKKVKLGNFISYLKAKGPERVNTALVTKKSAPEESNKPAVTT